MQHHLWIGSLCALGLLWLAIVLFPSSAEGAGPLDLCLNGAPDEPDGCETWNCWVEACRSAAERGHEKAIVLIGTAYVYGKGVPKDHVEAYMYFQVFHDMSDALEESEREGARKYSERALSELRDGMSPQEVARAEAQAREWMANQAQEIADLQMRRRIERALVLEGFSAGKRDGEFDRRTREAIRAWQRARGYAVTGELTDEQTASLLTPQSPCDSLGSTPDESVHGSIFFSRLDDDGEAFGIAWSEKTAEGARQAARTECKRRGGGEACADGGLFRNVCGALAVGDSNLVVTGGGKTRAGAERSALANCKSRNEVCRIEVSRCMGGGYRESGMPVVTLEPLGANWAVAENQACQIYKPNLQPGDEVTWSGACVDSKASGEGRFTWRGNHGVNVYQGELLEGRLHGRGLYQWAVGACYDGEFRDGKRHGSGAQTWPGGSLYRGEWCDGKRHGHGTLIWAGGDRYEGQWRSNKRHGRGTYTWGDGDAMTCEWRDGESVHGTCKRH